MPRVSCQSNGVGEESGWMCCQCELPRYSRQLYDKLALLKKSDTSLVHSTSFVSTITIDAQDRDPAATQILQSDNCQWFVRQFRENKISI